MIKNRSKKESQPVLIRKQSMFGSEPKMCSENVRKRINALGGKAVFGWLVRRDEIQEHWENHCVWESPEGELVDVTGDVEAVIGETLVYSFKKPTLFLRDDEAEFDRRSNPGRRFPLPRYQHNRHVIAACRFFCQSDEALSSGDLERCRLLTEKGNAEVAKVIPGYGMPVPDSLDMADIFKTLA